MATEITVPRLGWTMEEGTFLGWLKHDGDTVREGDALKAINGKKLTRDLLPQELLTHQAGAEVVLTIEDAEGKTRDVTVTAMRSACSS